jgi:hypothetical protein
MGVSYACDRILPDVLKCVVTSRPLYFLRSQRVHISLSETNLELLIHWSRRPAKAFHAKARRSSAHCTDGMKPFFMLPISVRIRNMSLYLRLRFGDVSRKDTQDMSLPDDLLDPNADSGKSLIVSIALSGDIC